MNLITFHPGERETQKRALLSLVNATSSQISEILTVPFMNFSRKLREGVHYFENLKPKNQSSREFTFTQKGVDYLLGLLDEYNLAVKSSKKGNEVHQVNKKKSTSLYFTYGFWSKKGVHLSDWEEARKIRPDYFGGGGCNVPSYIKTMYLEETLQLFLKLQKQRSLGIQTRNKSPI